MNKNNPGDRGFLWFLMLTSLTGGALIMVVEVLGSKVIGPYFGVSLFVWTSLIAVTMIALAAGYALGGLISDRHEHADFLYGIIAVSGFAVLLIPVLAPPVLRLCMPLGLRAGAFVSSSLLFGPSLFLMGCISPYVIKIATKELHSIGRTVGGFYAISTIGSVFGTVATGFVLIAFLGVSRIFFFVGCGLLLLSAAYFAVFRRKYQVIALLLPLFLFWPSEKAVDKVMENGTRVKVVASRESYYGNVKVVDYSYRDKHTRELVIDGAIHSGIDMNSGRSIYPYYYVLGYYPLLMNPQGRHCLVLGLGAGTIPDIYQSHGVTTDVLDIDPLIFEMAERYFNFHSNGETYIQDARYFLINTPKQYDYVVLDVFSGENMPAHLLSLEAFELVSGKLTESGILAFNMFGSVNAGSFMTVSIIKTLQQVFDQVDVYPMFDARGDQQMGNMSVIAYNGPSRAIDRNVFARIPSHPFVEATLARVHTWRWQPPGDQDWIVLGDDYLPLEFYNAWIREAIRKEIVRNTDWDVLSF